MSMQTTALLVITVTLLAFAAQSQATAQSSQLVFFELTVRDLARAKSFYGHVLGGTFSDSPSPDFVSINGAGVPGGILKDPNKKPGNGNIKIFFAVQDISATLGRAKQLGADVLLGETRVSPSRTLAEFRDPDGNVIGIMHEVGT
jgi:uncharacterized protein